MIAQVQCTCAVVSYVSSGWVTEYIVDWTDWFWLGLRFSRDSREKRDIDWNKHECFSKRLVLVLVLVLIVVLMLVLVFVLVLMLVLVLALVIVQVLVLVLVLVFVLVLMLVLVLTLTWV